MKKKKLLIILQIFLKFLNIFLFAPSFIIFIAVKK